MNKRFIFIGIIALALLCIVFTLGYNPRRNEYALNDFSKDTRLTAKEDTPPTYSIGLCFDDLSENSQRHLVHFLKDFYVAKMPYFIITQSPTFTKELLDQNNVSRDDIQIIPNYYKDTSMKDKLCKGGLYKALEGAGQNGFLIYINHTKINYSKLATIILHASRSRRDVLLFESLTGRNNSVSSDIVVVNSHSSRSFFRLWANFMEMFSLHGKSDDVEALDYVFTAEGYSDLSATATTEVRNPITFSTVRLETVFGNVRISDKAVTTLQPIPEPSPPVFTGLKDMNGEPVDYLIAIKAVTCTAQQAVENINRFQNPQRIIYMVVYPYTCKTLIAMGENVRCIWENHVIPGVSKKVIADHTKEKMIKKRAGWYLLQIMNVHASNLPGLSEHYVVWDADGVPTHKIPHFRNGKVVFYTGDEHDTHTFEGYHSSYEALTGLQSMDPLYTASRPDDGSMPTWVAHFMVFKKEYVREFIDAIATHRRVTPDRWMFEVVKVISAHRNPRTQRVGFGEYDAYGFFMKARHSDKFEVDIDSHKTCWRITSTPRSYRGNCCIPPEIFKEGKSRDAHYIVREWDFNRCDFTDLTK